MVLQNRKLRALCYVGFRASADPISQRFKLLESEETYRYMVGAHTLKMLNSDQPCAFEYIDQTNYAACASAIDLLNVQ